MLMLKDGCWYASKSVLDKLKNLTLLDAPHLTPDGYAVMVSNLGGRSVQPAADGTSKSVVMPPMLVVQADHGHDLQHAVKVNGQPVIARVEFSPDEIGDWEELKEYDHLPESRKDYAVYPRGHKLA